MGTSEDNEEYPAERAELCGENHQTTSKNMPPYTGKVIPKEVRVDMRPVVPILFLPGCMASNLKKVCEDESFWEPANHLITGIGMLLSFIKKTAGERADIFNPKNSEVYFDGTIKKAPLECSEESLHKKGWGSIMSSSYHHFMATLEHRLQHIGLGEGMYKSDSTLPPYRTAWTNLMQFDEKYFGIMDGKAKGSRPCITAEDLEHAKNFRFEVWAGGYQWLQSNEDSAKDIGNWINEILRRYESAGITVATGKKVLLITHSMGGFVARSLSLDKNYKEKILGVLHGAMPANGAAETYSNMRNGIPGALGKVAGDDSAKVGAVFVQALGPLQLLPFGGGHKNRVKILENGVKKSIYTDKWLFYQPGEDRPLEPVPPKNEHPYDNIYLAEDWWGFIPKSVEDTIPLPKGEGEDDNPTVRELLKKNIKNVRAYHKKIMGKYHPQTYSFWGRASNLPSVGLCCWKIVDSQRPPQDSKGNYDHTRLDTGKGCTFDGRVWYELENMHEAGDETVAESSWRSDVNIPNMVFILGTSKEEEKQGKAHQPGKTHQQSYCDERALNIGMYFVVKMAREIPIKK